MSSVLRSFSYSDAVALGFIVISFFVAWKFSVGSRRVSGRPPLPPGPSPLPLLGNVHQMPRVEEWKTYEAWAKEFGPITYMSMFGMPMIILNTVKAARELLDNRSRNYSHRPFRNIIKLCGLDWILTQAVGESHRVQRTVVQKYFSGPAALKHRTHQQDETMVFLRNVLSHPESWENHTKQYAASAILLGAYGYSVSNANDPIVEEMEQALKLGPTVQGLFAFLLELYPWLKFIPKLSSLLGLTKVTRAFTEARNQPFLRAKRMMDDSTAVPCFVSTSLDDIASDSTLSPTDAKSKQEIVIDSVSIMYGAGIETTIASTGTFFALVALHPQIMKKAQEEVDSVTNEERLPAFDDWDRLPYVRAIFLEVLRHNTVTPLGLPHSVVNDDIYEGLFIPGGSMIVANLWLIFRDPEIFVNPETFNPDRFLGDKGALCRETMNIVWGFGRRSCPGRQLAEAALYITMASVISCFDLAPQVTSGADDPKLSFCSGFLRKPILFPISITPRSRKWSELIESSEQHL